MGNIVINQKTGVKILIIFIILIVSATALAFKITSDVVDQEIKRVFQVASSQLTGTIQNRFNSQTLLLKAIQAFYYNNNQITRDEWSEYIRSIKLFENYPGIHSIALIPKQTVQGDEKYLVKYVESIDQKAAEKSLGFDFNSELVRKRTLDLAKKTGKITVSENLQSVFNGEPSFVVVLPVFKKSDPTNLEGLVVAAYRIKPLFPTIFKNTDPFPGLDFQIYNGEIAENALIYDHKPQNKIDLNSNSKGLRSTEMINIDENNNFYLLIEAEPTFSLTPTQRNLPKVILIGGLLSLLPFIIALIYTIIYRQKSNLL